MAAVLKGPIRSILVVPGNGGTALCPKVTNVTDVDPDDFAALVEFARARGVNLVVPGPEAPLVAGVSEHFRAANIRCFGPHNIPTAAYENFSDPAQALAYLDTISHDVVIKATGIAAGKGVIIPTTKEEARAAVQEIMVDRAFGAAGDEIVIEEYLDGQELSILTFSDGTNFQSLPAAQDHKRIFDGDQGPNTGGMGCYAPTPIATPALMDIVNRDILEPTFRGMRREGNRFVGVLFTGLMITKDGPKVLEYNVRFGDPETQTVLPLVSADTDLADVMLHCVDGCLDGIDLKIDDRFSATVGVQLIQFDGMFFRKDIAHRALRPAEAPAAADAQPQDTGLTYAQAGVSIEAGNALVERIRAAVSSTKRAGADAEIGGFGGELDLAQCGFPGAPVLVGAIDGVGTKLMVAQAIDKHDTVGIDLVAMNVNDLVVQGAQPLMFLDYYGCSKLDVAAAASFVEGVADGCIQAGCALVGGETAEMPGLYHGKDYDAAGAAIGIGDVLLGLASTGVHSNGFSLVRKILSRADVAFSAPAPWNPSLSAGESLLTPTRIYGLAHITGGGLVENPRMLPPPRRRDRPLLLAPTPVFAWLQDAGAASQVLADAGESVFTVGRLVKRAEGAEGVVLLNSFKRA
ncbi:unnamed protein product [Parascedosporium putredinis]|uniref:ATP-grasp domain-containing protein n=1 Tax=Parascedosporium putredinis TaxID=1442378 RepID=A0A9P1MDK0_9PEZI|nr:unnamed protein product [Parascedosporium putredinis]CAI8003837.1 unnamed protein product [Parascedosporium putredinis]